MTRRILALAALAALAPAADLNIPFERYKLKNGLRVILSPDPSVPVVSVYVLYDVGARAEEKGRSGFAHLFEHMMFQGSANAPKGVHFKTVEANGGNLNGSTHADYTDYFETMPSNKLQVALWLESDRMRSLAISDENLTNQKEAVKEERRLRMDNQPYVAAIVDDFPALAFTNWQSSHTLIGTYEDLNAATVADVAKFFKTYYAPNNAVLVVCGDIDAKAKEWIEGYFSDIAAQPQPKRPDLSEPPQTTARTKKRPDPLAQVPGVVVSWPGPKRRSADYYAMAMLDAVLTGGSSSRFAQNLVKGKESVVQYEANLGWPFGGPSDYIDPGVYAMFLVHKPDFTGAAVAGHVEEELAKIRKDGVPEAELNRVRAFIRSSRIREMQSTMRRAALLAQYELFDGDPGLVNTELAKWTAVTSDQIKGVANRYLRSNARTMLEVIPAPKKEAK